MTDEYRCQHIFHIEVFSQIFFQCQGRNFCDVIGANNTYFASIVIAELTCLTTSLDRTSRRDVLVSAVYGVLAALNKANVNTTTAAPEINQLVDDLQDYVAEDRRGPFRRR